VLIGFAISLWEFAQKSKAEVEQGRLRKEAQAAQAGEAQARRLAEQQERAALRKAYASDMKLLQQALAVDDLGRAQELLNRHRPKPGQEDLRGWEWRYFWQFCRSDAAFTLCNRSNSIVAVSFSRNGSLLAVGTWDGEVSVWDLTSRQMIFRQMERLGHRSRLAFSPTDDLLAYYSSSAAGRRIALWDGRTGRELRALPLRTQVRDLAFTADGQLLSAEYTTNNQITLWNLETGEPARRFTAPVGGSGMGRVFDVAPGRASFRLCCGGGRPHRERH
jgi:hypothetical protein